MLLSFQQWCTRKCSPILAFLKSCSRLAGRTASACLPSPHWAPQTTFKEDPKGRRVNVSSSEAGLLKEERMLEVPLWVVLAWTVNKCRISTVGWEKPYLASPLLIQYAWRAQTIPLSFGNGTQGGWRNYQPELSSSEAVTVLTWTTYQVNITFTCLFPSKDMDNAQRQTDKLLKASSRRRVIPAKKLPWFPSMQ